MFFFQILSMYKTLDLKAPMPGCLSTSVRELIHQGPLKLKDSVTKNNCEVNCFLFTDMLLITQPIKKANKKFKIIKPPICTSRMVFRELTQTDKPAFVIISLNNYNLPEFVHMFISPIAKKWLEAFETAHSSYVAELEAAKNATMFSYQQNQMQQLQLKHVKELRDQQEFYSSHRADDNVFNFDEPLLKSDELDADDSPMEEESSTGDACTRGKENFDEVAITQSSMSEYVSKSADASLRRDSNATITTSSTDAEIPSQDDRKAETDQGQANDCKPKKHLEIIISTCNGQSTPNESSELNGELNSSSDDAQSMQQQQSYQIKSHSKPSTLQPAENNNLNPRRLDRRLDRPRRNMTDPLASVSNVMCGVNQKRDIQEMIMARSAAIRKRNSLNENGRNDQQIDEEIFEHFDHQSFFYDDDDDEDVIDDYDEYQNGGDGEYEEADKNEKSEKSSRHKRAVDKSAKNVVPHNLYQRYNHLNSKLNKPLTSSVAYGDSTSTIMSTDSGVSSNSCYCGSGTISRSPGHRFGQRAKYWEAEWQ